MRNEGILKVFKKMCRKIFTGFIAFFVFIFTFLALVFIDARFIEPRLLFVKDKTLYLPNWDKRLDGFRVAVISDLHIGTKDVGLDRLNVIVNKVNAKKPDLIVFLGDFDSQAIQNTGYSDEELAGIFKKLRAKYGVISVLGNHDYHYPYPVRIRKFLSDAGVKILENEDMYIYVNGAKLNITGFKDLWYFKFKPREVLRQGVKCPIMVLAHNPDSFFDIPENVSLTLSGHTHGGEINLPFLGSPIVPSEFGQRYRKGHIIEDGRHLYVSGGVATLSGFRFLNPPEISILKLYSEAGCRRVMNTREKKGFNKKHWKKCVEIYSKYKNGK